MRLNYRKGLILAILPAFLFTQCQQPASKEPTSTETAAEDLVALRPIPRQCDGVRRLPHAENHDTRRPCSGYESAFYGHPAEEPFPPAFDTTLISKTT
ncbi:MAG: hypothetical protein IPN20_03350 [Haliscomenobacter sp.]|nr:hypothetical protein [Haliscomenobacter sp.]